VIEDSETCNQNNYITVETGYKMDDQKITTIEIERGKITTIEIERGKITTIKGVKGKKTKSCTKYDIVI
jgi:hypothetical protein